MATHPITGRTLPDGTSAPAGATQINALEDHLADRGYLVWTFGSSALRQTAMNNSGLTLTTTHRVICFLADQSTIEVWDGLAWKTLKKLANIGAAPASSSTAFGASGPFNNTSLGYITTYDWTWTPSLTGLAVVSFLADCQQNAAGYGSFTLQALRDGTTLTMGRDIMYEGVARTSLRATSHPFRVTAGTPVALRVQCAVYAAAGSVKVNAYDWAATVVPE